MKIGYNVALITVTRVKVQKTIKRNVTKVEQKKVLHHNATEWEKGEQEVVEQRQDIADVQMITAYLIQAENV